MLGNSFSLLNSLIFFIFVSFLNKIGHVVGHLLDGSLILLFQRFQCATVSVSNETDNDTFASGMRNSTEKIMKKGN